MATSAQTLRHLSSVTGKEGQGPRSARVTELDVGLAQAKKGQMAKKLTSTGCFQGPTGRGDGSAEKRKQEARTVMERWQIQRTWIQREPDLIWAGTLGNGCGGRRWAVYRTTATRHARRELNPK